MKFIDFLKKLFGIEAPIVATPRELQKCQNCFYHEVVRHNGDFVCLCHRYPDGHELSGGCGWCGEWRHEAA